MNLFLEPRASVDVDLFTAAFWIRRLAMYRRCPRYVCPFDANRFECGNQQLPAVTLKRSSLRVFPPSRFVTDNEDVRVVEFRRDGRLARCAQFTLLTFLHALLVVQSDHRLRLTDGRGKNGGIRFPKRVLVNGSNPFDLSHSLLEVGFVLERSVLVAPSHDRFRNPRVSMRKLMERGANGITIDHPLDPRLVDVRRTNEDTELIGFINDLIGAIFLFGFVRFNIKKRAERGERVITFRPRDPVTIPRIRSSMSAVKKVRVTSSK